MFSDFKLSTLQKSRIRKTNHLFENIWNAHFQNVADPKLKFPSICFDNDFSFLEIIQIFWYIQMSRVKVLGLEVGSVRVIG